MKIDYNFYIDIYENKLTLGRDFLQNFFVS